MTAPADLYPVSSSPELIPSVNHEVKAYVMALYNASDSKEQVSMLFSGRISELRQVNWGDYSGGRFHGEYDNELAEGLARFAADESSSSSALVRLTALEAALNCGYDEKKAEVPYPTINTLSAAAARDDELDDGSDVFRQGRAYRHATSALIDSEGLDADYFFLEWEFDDHARGSKLDDDNIPYKALRYLDILDGELASDNPSEQALKFAPFMTTLKNQLADYHGIDRDIPVRLQDWIDIHACSKLLDYGENYADKMTELLRSNDPLRMEYIHQIGDMYSRAWAIERMFPAEYGQGVNKGIRRLLGDALYAVMDHVSKGSKTRAAIPLKNSKKSLPLNLDGDEPHRLLSSLHTAFGVFHEMGWMGRPSTLKVAEGEGFSLYRLGYSGIARSEDGSYLGDKRDMSRASVYIRPYGGTAYDPNIEYGRPSEGVEASISYVIDTASTTQLLEVGKHRRRGNDERISIRLDREGVRPEDRSAGVRRDPTQTEGTVSLDVGSVLGNDNWTSTKLGRMLAWGNMLRTSSQGEESNLNHMLQYFRPEQGHAEIFAKAALTLRQTMEQGRMSPENFSELFAGRIALKRGVKQA